MKTRDLRPFLEAIAAVFLVVVAGVITNREDPCFVDVRLHPFLFITMFIASWYGAIPGRFAGTLGGIAYIAGVYVREKVYSPRLIFEFNTYFLPIVFLFTGALLGEVRRRFKQRQEDAEAKAANLEEKFRTAEDHIKVLKYTNAEIETAVAGNFSTFSVLYEAARKLDTFDRGELFRAVGSILADQLRFDAFALYLKAGGVYRRVAGKWTVAPPESVSDFRPLTHSAITQHAVLSVRDAPSGSAGSPADRLLISAPLIDSGGEILGFIEVYEIPFLKFNPNTIKMFEMTSEWIAKTLEQIREFEWQKSKNIIDETLGVYTYPYFIQRIVEEFERAREYAMPLSLAVLSVDDIEEIVPGQRIRFLKTLTTVLRKNLASIDIVARYRADNQICMLLLAKGEDDTLERVDRIRAELAQFDFHPYADRSRPLAYRLVSASFQMQDESEEYLIGRVEEKLTA